MTNNKCYLGDGAYCEFDGYQFIITTSDGIHTTNSIYIEPVALKQLFEFAKAKGWTYP